MASIRCRPPIRLELTLLFNQHTNIREMKNFNINIIKIGILAAVFLAGCKSDFLDRPAQGQYSEGTYPFAEGTGAFDPAIFEAYDALRLYGVHSAGFQAATSIRSDDA